MSFRNESRDRKDLNAEIQRRLDELERRRPNPTCDCATCCAHLYANGGGE